MKRSDGRIIRSLDPFTKIIPFIMVQRNDAQNLSKQAVEAEPILSYVRELRERGHAVSCLHLFIAVYVRLLARRPALNRFVMNRRLYARDGIHVSLAIKKRLSDDADETTVKFRFNGTESLFDVARIVDEGIEKAYSETDNATDALARRIMALPPGLIAFAVGTLKRLDRMNLLPASVIEASPFHTSLFFTYLKSIRLDYIYHHLYNFGTTGLFVALGKEKRMPVVDGEEVVVRKCFEIGYVSDERICDGLYFVRSWHMLLTLLADPRQLENRLPSVEADLP